MWHRVRGSTVILWSYENTFCVQRKRKCLLFHVSSLTSRGMHTQASWYSCEDKSKTGREEKKLLNKIIIFVFFAHNRYSRSFITLKLNHWCHICTILMMSLLPFWALNMSVALLSTEGQRALGFHQKDLHLCFEEEWRSYGFRTTWEWVTNDRISILDKYFFNISFNFCKKKKGQQLGGGGGGVWNTWKNNLIVERKQKRKKDSFCFCVHLCNYSRETDALFFCVCVPYT